MVLKYPGPAVDAASRRRRLILVFVLFSSVGVGRAAPQEPAIALPRVAIEDDGSGSALGLLDEVGSKALAAAVRIVLPGPPAESASDPRLTVIEQRRIPLWLSLPAPNAESEIVPWRAALKRFVERHGSTLAVLEITVDRQPTRIAVFAVQAAATEARAVRESIRVALGGEATIDVARRGELYTADLAPYVDLLSLPENRIDAAEAWLQRIDPGARIVVTSGGGSPPQDSARMLIDGVIQGLGTIVASRSWRSAELTPEALRALAPLSTILAHEISIVESEAVALTLTAGARDLLRSLPYRLFFDTVTFSTLLVYSGTASDEPMAISLRLPIEGTPGILDVLTGDRIPAGGYARDPVTFRTSVTAPLTGRPMLVNFNEGAGAIGEKSDVSAERQLTVGEIISRHQQQQLAQDRLVRNYVADARMRQYFRPTETDPGYDIGTENRYFVADDGVEWEELSFAVNGRRWTDNRPSFPMLQPEKVLSLPLQLRFDEGYRYRLQGIERVDGFDCYELRFEPVRDDPSLYRGTVWIDRKTFARIRVHGQQGGLRGMVVSNEETLRYAPVATIGNQPVFLLRSMNGSQNMLIAGRTKRLDKAVEFSEFKVNAEDFGEARTTARRGDRIMYRETPGGLRYYVKRDGERVVSDRPTDGVKAMAMGLIVDPSYAFPLPIFGINYVDFSFGNPDTQLAMLFAGVLAAGNIQHPQFGSKRVDASVDFFAIAAPSSERLYAPDGELESERVLTWPLSTGLNLGWRATPFQTFSLQYQLRFDGYVRDTTTSESFALPSSTVTNGIGGQWEYNRHGYSVMLNGSWFTRASWEPWGLEQADGGRLSTPRSYSKFTASVSRDFFIDALQKVHVNAAWFGGRDLDRFVKYQFGLFDATRIHGVPAAVRFGELAMARGSYSINVFDQYRLDVFLEHAWGRDGGDDREWQLIPGIGAAFNLPAPWNTILRADVGKSWLPERYGSLGSTSLQIMLLKPL